DLQVQNTLKSCERYFVQLNLSVKWRAADGVALEGPRFTIKGDRLFTTIRYVRTSSHGKSLVRSEVSEVQVNMIVNGARLVLLQISHPNLAILDLQTFNRNWLPVLLSTDCKTCKIPSPLLASDKFHSGPA